jgi:hypothetical protein
MGSVWHAEGLRASLPYRWRVSTVSIIYMPDATTVAQDPDN